MIIYCRAGAVGLLIYAGRTVKRIIAINFPAGIFATKGRAKREDFQSDAVFERAALGFMVRAGLRYARRRLIAISN